MDENEAKECKGAKNSVWSAEGEHITNEVVIQRLQDQSF